MNTLLRSEPVIYNPDESRNYLHKTGRMPDGVWAIGGVDPKDFPEYIPIMFTGKWVGVISRSPMLMTLSDGG